MSDDTQDDRPRAPMDQLRDLDRQADELSVAERFRKTSQVALLLAYDLIDKLRYWEKETLARPEDEIAERLEHLVRSVDQLRTAYLTFSDLEL